MVPLSESKILIAGGSYDEGGGVILDVSGEMRFERVLLDKSFKFSALSNQSA